MIRFFDLDFFNEVWHTITKNKGRSFLTAFGVFWGILIFVLLKGVGDGIERQLFSMFSDEARNFMIIFPGTTTEPYDGFQRGRVPDLHNSDLEAVKNKIPQVKLTLPMVFTNWEESKLRHSDKAHEADSFIGISEDMSILNPPIIREGRYLNHIDIKEARKVCLIGDQIRNALYSSDEKVVGSIIWIGSSAYQVAGVVSDKGTATMMFKYSKSVFVPYTTMQRIYGYGDKITYAGIGIPSGIDGVDEEIEQILRYRCHVSPTDRGGIYSFSTKEIFDQFNALFFGINFLTYLVGIGTLLCGMVGVSNIMLVTVRERTQEIGVKRALGATPFSIIIQIVTESFVLALLAGLVGIVAGVGILSLADFVLYNLDMTEISNLKLQLQLDSAVTAVLIIAFMGMAAGLLPSFRAIKIKAIDALRDE